MLGGRGYPPPVEAIPCLALRQALPHCSPSALVQAEATEVNGAKPPKPKAVGKVKQLWVQWGLLGLTVGVIVAAAQFMGIGPEEVQTLIGGTGADLGALGGAEDVVASTVDALGGDVVDRVDIMEIAAALGVNADVLKVRPPSETAGLIEGFGGRTVRCARAVRKVGCSPPPGVR